MNGSVDSAIILAAGRGLRLKPLTDSLPKTLIPVCGKPILQRIFDALHTGAGVKQFQIVAGYRAEDFDRVQPPPNCSKHILVNKDWESSGSMLSLSLAYDFLNRGCFIVEGDCCFGAELFAASAQNSPEALWFARPFGASDDGCTVWPDSSGIIRKFTIEKPGAVAGDPKAWKSCGVMRLTPEIGSRFASSLADAANSGRRNECYDSILADHLANIDIRLAPIGDAPWQEIDNASDWENAEQLFGLSRP